MITILGLDVSSQIFFRLMVSFTFFVGIILMISPEAFEALNRALLKEYGLKTRIFPKLENSNIDIIDKAIVRNRVFAGLALAVIAFILLLIYR